MNSRKSHSDGRRRYLLCRYLTTDQCCYWSPQICQYGTDEKSPYVLWENSPFTQGYKRRRKVYRRIHTDLGCVNEEIIIILQNKTILRKFLHESHYGCLTGRLYSHGASTFFKTSIGIFKSYNIDITCLKF